MTYKQMTKEIEAINEQIEFLYSIRRDLYKGQRDKEIMIGNIANNLCAYQNYLRFSKEYEEKWFVDLTICNIKRKVEKQTIKRGEWVKCITAPYNWCCSECGCGFTDNKLTFLL